MQEDIAQAPKEVAAILDHMTTQATHIAPKLLTGAVIFMIFVIAAYIVKFIIAKCSNGRKYRVPLYHLIADTVKVIIIIAGGVTALGTMGVNVSALVASLGLAGFAVGFALKDSLSNLLAGFMVLFYRPFKVGDHITVASNEGEVIAINLRYTIMKAEGQRALIPNATVLNSPVIVKE